MASDMTGRCVFISGPMTMSATPEGRREFDSAEMACLRMGASRVVNPARILDDGAISYSGAVRRRVSGLVRCADVMVQLPRWDFDECCLLERHVALDCGIEVIGAVELEGDADGSEG